MCDGHERCTRHPVYRVRVHRLDRCNTPPLPDGHYRLCPLCLRATALRIEIQVRELRTQQAADGLMGPARCTACQRPVSALHDLLDVEYDLPATGKPVIGQVTA